MYDDPVNEPDHGNAAEAAGGTDVSLEVPGTQDDLASGSMAPDNGDARVVGGYDWPAVAAEGWRNALLQLPEHERPLVLAACGGSFTLRGLRRSLAKGPAGATC